MYVSVQILIFSRSPVLFRYDFIFSNYNWNWPVSKWGHMPKVTGQHWVSSSIAFYLHSLAQIRTKETKNETVSYWTWQSSFGLGFLASEFQQSPCLCLSLHPSHPSAGVTGTCYLPCFYVGAGVRRPSQQALYHMGHLPSTFFFFNLSELLGTWYVYPITCEMYR